MIRKQMIKLKDRAKKKDNDGFDDTCQWHFFRIRSFHFRALTFLTIFR